MRRSQAQTIDWLDRAALLGSAACMIHCLALPLLIAMAPALSAIVAIPESFHRWVLLFALPLAAAALAGGHAHHAARWPIGMGAAGLLSMALGAFAAPAGAIEVALTVIGSLLVAGAHIGNWHLRRTCPPPRHA